MTGARSAGNRLLLSKGEDIGGPVNAPVLPVRWNDNEVSLWPGESTTLTATYRTADLNGATPSVRVSGWNVATSTAK